FVELEPGVDGLVHISQCALTRINKVEDAVNVGDIVNVKVLSVDPEAKRISLSIRALLEQERREGSAEAEGAASNAEEAVAVDIQAVGQQLEAEAQQQEAPVQPATEAKGPVAEAEEPAIETEEPVAKAEEPATEAEEPAETDKA
ncbi:MAG: S1 RNA-binding domain-containing protein, partial [Eubacteriales bacterium]|nr:S1 RNA-binding domain-containing protein [Eubacteriales bacterium]